MGWTGRAYEDMSDSERGLWNRSIGSASCGVSPNPFKPYVPEQVKVVLSIADQRFEREISEKRIIKQKSPQDKWYECVMLVLPPEEVPDSLLQGVPRNAFVAKWHARLGKSWGTTFMPQDDGSFIADQSFLDNVADIVNRVQKEI